MYFRLKSVVKYLLSIYPVGLVGIELKDTHAYLWISSEELVNFSLFLKKHSLLKFEGLLDVWGVDYLFRYFRYEVNYLFVSFRYNLRFILKICPLYSSAPSLSTIYYSADWLEREVWDMFGIFFVGHSDLRRILTDYGFDGFPLRKDFPLSGFREVAYDDGEKRVMSFILSLLQEFRIYRVDGRWYSIYS